MTTETTDSRHGRRSLFIWSSVLLAFSAGIITTLMATKEGEASSNRLYALASVNALDEDGITTIRELTCTFHSTESENGYTTVAVLYDAPGGGTGTRLLATTKWVWNAGNPAYEGTMTQTDDAPSGGQYTFLLRTYDVNGTNLETHTETYTVP